MTGLPRCFDELARLGVEAQVSPDTLLWRQGDPGRDVVVLLEGTLEVTQEGPEGDEIVLGTLEEGAILGEMASLSQEGQTRSAAVKAASPCRILRVPSGPFRELVRARPDILEELFWLQVGRVRALTEQVAKAGRTMSDRLTKLYNMTFFRERLRLELERAREMGDLLSVVMFEVDRFEDFTDARGRHEGNRVLVEVAQIVRGAARRGDIVSRGSGAQFAVLMYGGARVDATRYAHKARERVAEAAIGSPATDPPLLITVSAGTATCPTDGLRVDVLMDVAEVDLASAQEAGGNRVGRPSD